MIKHNFDLAYLFSKALTENLDFIISIYYQNNQMKVKFFSVVLSLFIINIVTGHNPHKPNPPLIATLVTAWWPKLNVSDKIPTG
jgi:hypothetical protein